MARGGREEGGVSESGKEEREGREEKEEMIAGQVKEDNVGRQSCVG